MKMEKIIFMCLVVIVSLVSLQNNTKLLAFVKWSSFYENPLIYEYDSNILFSSKLMDNGSTNIVALDPNYGFPLWRKPVILNIGKFTADDVYVTRKYLVIINRYQLKEPLLYCYNVSNGQLMWVFSRNKTNNLEFFSIVDDKIFFDKYCLDAKTGNILKEFKIKLGKVKIYKDNTYLISSNGIVCYEIGNDKVKWHTIGQSSSDDKDCCIPADINVACENNVLLYKDKVVLIDYDNSSDFGFSLFCRDVETGRVLWKQPYYYNSIHSFGNTLVCFRDTSPLSLELHLPDIVAYNIDNGSILWEKSFNAKLTCFCKTDTIKKIRYINKDQYICSMVDKQNANILKYINIYNGEEILSKSIYIPRDNNFIFTPNMIFYTGVSMSLYDFDRPPPSNLPIEELKISIGNPYGYHNNEKFINDPPPAVINGNLYVNANIFKNINGNISWNKLAKKTIVVLSQPEWSKSNGRYLENIVELWINNPIAEVDGKEVQIDPKNPKITPIIKDGRTMVPLRFLAENLGCTVKWVADTKTIIVTYQP